MEHLCQLLMPAITLICDRQTDGETDDIEMIPVSLLMQAKPKFISFNFTNRTKINMHIHASSFRHCKNKGTSQQEWDLNERNI